ncbi:ABC transporter ATP-binding protein [Marichromatium bheemlicum]|uniref:ABC transporter ATP-binding protein n=1 Tax=Marichromatium bheemlicum TaxID=365339 RepID=A0ABX1I5L3_9GAMM|nr:ABC transporter ATP-binding protein [Marichromatium bheemlicum]NKN32747.1 ABC transporter ATP-binding protein [Marichromatium bheemlicum]
MSSDSTPTVISASNLSKCFHIYDKPRDRLKQMLAPGMARLARRQAPQYFREFWALRDVDFEIKQGETVGIVGSNGSGKSTLLQLICGTLSPTTGTLQTQGRIAALLELGSGFNLDFTGRENVYMNGIVLGMSKEEIAARFDDIAAFADIGPFIDQPVKSYSSGMLVRLAFAVAINVDPQILVIDEALSVGDELFQRKCFSRIEAIRDSGTTILFVSHSGHTVIELCDRAILLDAGERLASGEPKHIIGYYQKLLYAPADKRTQIRAAILEHDTSKSGQREVTQEDAQTQLNEPPPTQETTLESYDPGMKPDSTISYESHGAIISEARITTPAGERVNNLCSGGVYCYQYRVYFDRPITHARFSMLIKTTSGVNVGGSISAANMREGIDHIAANIWVDVEFQFDCMLNPGTYFLNAGVLGISDGEETFLHRLVDAEMFRVLPDTRRTATGIVDFSCRPRILINHQ